MSGPLKVIVVGAGLGGLSCAIISRHHNIDVVILEKAKKIEPLGAGIQIPPNASRVWYQYDLIEKLRRFSVVSKGMELRRWQNGELLCRRTVGENLDERWPWLIIHRADYHRVLIEEAERLGADLRLGAEVVKVDFEGTKVSLESGEIFSGDVIIGADGIWSDMRSQLLGHPSPPQETGNVAYRGTFPRVTLEALKDPDVDKLCEQDVITSWIGPESNAVFYPVKCKNEFNLIFARPDDLPADVRTAQGDLEEMRKVFEGWDPVFTKILSAFTHVLKWKMCHHYELASWTKASMNNTALLGDACHPSLPYQAQGAAMAVEDGTILATLLGLHQSALRSAKPHPSLPETLKLYETLQKGRTTTMSRGAISNQHLYHLKDGAEQEERDRILKSASWAEKSEGESETFIWIDVKYQKGILAWDCVGQAKKKWEEWLIGRS